MSTTLWKLPILLLWVLGPLLGTSQAALVINEVLAQPGRDWNGDGSLCPQGDEWIEVHNTGLEQENLGRYFLRTRPGEEAQLQLHGLLAPGATAVFFGSDALAWQQGEGLAPRGLGLDDQGASLELLLAGQDLEVPLLPVAWLSLSASQCARDRSCGHDTDGGRWLLFDGLNPCSAPAEPPGSGCLPSPGHLNHCLAQLPLAASTWDGLKACYR